MCGFVGIVNFKENIGSKKDVLISMNNTLQKEDPMNVDIMHPTMFYLGTED